MKRFFALVLVLILATAAAYADTTFWDNGALNGRTDRCDANTQPASALGGPFTMTSWFQTALEQSPASAS